MSETKNENSLSTVEITISFPSWIRLFVSDILFCPGNTDFAVCNVMFCYLYYQWLIKYSVSDSHFYLFIVFI